MQQMRNKEYDLFLIAITENPTGTYSVLMGFSDARVKSPEFDAYEFDAYELFRAMHSHNSTQYPYIQTVYT